MEAIDGSFFAELSVRDLGKTWARVKACYVSHHEPDEDPSEDAWMQAFTVASHHKGFVVRRNSNDADASGHFADRGDAVQAARDMYRR